MTERELFLLYLLIPKSHILKQRNSLTTHKYVIL
jgi:hypothetical protein